MLLPLLAISKFHHDYMINTKEKEQKQKANNIELYKKIRQCDKHDKRTQNDDKTMRQA